MPKHWRNRDLAVPLWYYQLDIFIEFRVTTFTHIVHIRLGSDNYVLT